MTAPKLAAILIQYSEATAIGDNVVFHSIEEADQALVAVGEEAQGRNYLKTGFCIVTERDGELDTYTGRFDITAQEYNLEADLRRKQRFLSGPEGAGTLARNPGLLKGLEQVLAAIDADKAPEPVVGRQTHLRLVL